MSAWSSLKLLTQQTERSSLQKGILEEQEHIIVARALQKFRLRAKMSNTYSDPPLPMAEPPQFRGLPPVTIRQVVPVYSDPNIAKPPPTKASPTSIPYHQ